MAVTGMLVLLVSNGLTATALSVYDESLLNEFGWSRGELKFRDLVTFWLVAMIAPFAGGQGVYLRYLSKALVEAGHRVDVIYLRFQ